MKVEDPFIYFLMEHNVVVVYRIETQHYITLADLIDSLHKWETFKIDHSDDFEAFDHKGRQPIEGRGILIDQDVLNKMVEEINHHIQRIRHTKELDDSLGAVHIVTSESVAGSLRVGLDGPKTVIGFPDTFSIGPLWKLDEKTGRSLRNEWLFENINFELEDYEYGNKITNTLREIEDLADRVPIYIWYGNNADEQTGLRFYLYLLREKTNEIYLMNANELYEGHNDAAEPILHTSQMDSEIFRMIFAQGKENTLLSNKKRLQLHREWERLAQTKDLLRVWSDDEIIGVPEHHYDSFILEAIEKLHDEQEAKDFIKTGSVIGEIATQVGGATNLFFLEYRIRYLVYSGVLELKGIPKSMRHYSIKLR